MVDDYGGYKEIFRQVLPELACLAHCRRKFFDLQVAGKHPVAQEALRRIAELYAIEAEAREAMRRRAGCFASRRRCHAMRALHDWWVAQRVTTADGTGLARAIDYSLKRPV